MAGQIPGLQAVPDAVDGAGRHGIGVASTYSGGRMILVFDAHTNAFLGTAYTPPPPAAGASYTTVLRQAIVDRVGQLP